MSEFLLSTNLLADRHIYQFNKYQKPYKAESSRNPDPTAATPVARMTSSSLIERATQEHRAREQNITNDMHAELTRYLAENLLMINYADSPECQAEVILQWWKVAHSAAGLLVNLTNLLILQDNATRYLVLSCITLDYLPIQGSSVPCEHIFSDTGLTDMKCHAQLLPENFSAIQTVKGKYKKEWRCCQAQIDAKRVVEKNQWMDDSIVEV